MKCPKCGKEIADNLTVCPHCKKVLKLICPICKTENKSNTCKKCGFAIITKCHKCGKINNTIVGKCSKCGFSTYTSAAINSSNIDEFACLTVEFPNISEFKDLFGSTKLFDKFKNNLDTLIVNYTKAFKLKREIINDVYIIRFNKDYTFNDSAINAINAAIAIQNLVTELNFKLQKLGKALLSCNIAVLKRDIYSKPSDYKSGFNIKILYANSKKTSLLNRLQIITDNSIYNEVSEKFQLTALSSVLIKQNMVMFFELNLKKYIKLPEDKKEEETNPLLEIPEESFEDDKPLEQDAAKIDFSNINCNFVDIENMDFYDFVSSKISSSQKNIISIKKEKNFLVDTFLLINSISEFRKFSKVINIVCSDEMKLEPYGFFNELFSQAFNFVSSPNLAPTNEFAKIKDDKSGFIKDLISSVKREFPHPEDCRFSLFDIFINNFYDNLKNSLIIIEDIDKIDDTSLEFLLVLLKKFNEFDINFITINSTGFSLHKPAHFLLNNTDYTEINLKKSYVKKMLKKHSEVTKLLVNTPYLETISKYTKGNCSYFDLAMSFLITNKVISITSKGNIEISSNNEILIPPSADKIIEHRLIRLKKLVPEAYSLFAQLAFTGYSINSKMFQLYQTPDFINLLKVLINEKLVFFYGDSIYIKYYKTVGKILLKQLSQEEKKNIALKIINNIYCQAKRFNREVYLYEIIEDTHDEFETLQNISEVSASFGDFSAYWEGCNKLLKMIDNHMTENSQEEVDKYKMQIYENLASLLYKYSPDKIQNIAQIILDNLEKNGTDDEIVILCNKMLQGCLLSGNYSYALKLIHNILSRFPLKSVDPDNENFDITYFMLNMVKIEILFSIGDLNDCANAGDEILKIFTNKNILDYRPENVNAKQFFELVSDSFMFSGLAKVMMLKPDLKSFLTNLNNIISNEKDKSIKIPKCFELLPIIENMFHGYDVSLPQNENIFNDKFSKILLKFIKAFTTYKNSPTDFANIIYEAKTNAINANLKQFELLCDTLIGYSYLQLENYQKASSIFYDIEEVASKKGLRSILYICWYFIAKLKVAENDIDFAINIANDVSIKMEQSENSSDFLQFLLKVLLKTLYLKKGIKNKADFCQKHIDFLQMKYNLNIIKK